MRAPSLLELRRALARALLAAPLAMGCESGKTSTTTPPPPVRPDAAAAVHVPPPAPDAAPVAKDCPHDPPDISGCGGADVYLHASLADCGLPAKGDLTKDRCDDLCKGFETRACEVEDRSDGKVAVYCEAANPCMGRPTSDGALATAHDDGTAIDRLAEARRMEAHSVIAFRELEADLVRFGAPASLVDSCRVAADDDCRHARAMARLLRARGVRPAAIDRPRAAGFASLFALAAHNEREGVVGESWGALLALHQAERARDADVRDEMRAIADEETSHAALSIEIARWVRTQLSDESVAALDDARRAAIARLRGSFASAPEELGLPAPATAAAMLDALAPALTAS
jgi:hypothetical protein